MAQDDVQRSKARAVKTMSQTRTEGTMSQEDVQRLDGRLTNIENEISQLAQMLRDRAPSSQTPGRLTSEEITARLDQAHPGALVDFSDFHPREVESVAQQLMKSSDERSLQESRARDLNWDLGPHVQVNVKQWWWSPLGLAEIRFDREACDSYDRAITFPNLLAVGVPIPVAGIVAGVIRIAVAVASRNGLIIFVQLPSLVHWYLPA